MNTKTKKEYKCILCGKMYAEKFVGIGIYVCNECVSSTIDYCDKLEE